MTLRALPDDFPAATVAAIDARLDAICAQEGVAIPLAIESGSRAWGFPSPDSDFDCRFIYVRPAAQHLTPWPRRDVIETPLDAVLDVNGWDLAKALKLVLKGNAVLIEWLRAPIVYRGAAWFREALLAFAATHADRDLIAQHYLHLGERQRRVHFTDDAQIPLKRLFYVLRPAATLRWLRMHSHAAIAPMHLPTVLSACDPPLEFADLVTDLLARKAVTRELGSAPLPTPIARFIDEEFALAHSAFAGPPRPVSATARAETATLYRAIVERVSAEPTHPVSPEERRSP